MIGVFGESCYHLIQIRRNQSRVNFNQSYQSQKQDRQSQAMQIFNLSTLEQFPNIFQVNMRAPPEAVRTQIQQLLVDRMVKKTKFCLVDVCPTALVVVCSSGLVIACSTSLVEIYVFHLMTTHSIHELASAITLSSACSHTTTLSGAVIHELICLRALNLTLIWLTCIQR